MESNGCCRSCCVPYKGAVLLLIWTALLHGVFYYGVFELAVSIVNVSDVYSHHTQLQSIFIVVSISRAVTYLLYPVAGLLAELYCSRYKVMIVGTVIIFIGAAIALPAVSFLTFTWFYEFRSYKIIIYIAAAIGTMLYQFGLGLFEANAIQFGVDQLLFASNDNVSKFVNWYYWAITFLQIPGFIYLGVIFTIASLFCSCCKRHYMIEPVGHVNPVKHIAKVLRYARHHTAPVLRSAFTYGEGPPSRLDLAKDRYGGPYTTEEVEDVKSFGRILLLLSSQFGILLVGGVSLFEIRLTYVFRDLAWIAFYVLMGGKPAWYLTCLIIMPVYMIVIRPYFQQYIPSMIKRMGIGLVLAIISMSLVIPADDKPYLILHNTSNASEINIDKETISLGILAQVTGSLAYLLNFLTVLEFILAQGPRSMQGLLIGIWYAYQAVAVLVQLANVIFIYHSSLLAMIKLPLAVTSFIMYVIVSRWYRYRERNEASDINQQNIIEEYTERQLLRKPNDTEISYSSLVATASQDS